MAVAPDGELAGFCVGWFDGERYIGQVEPVGVHPRFQRMGLGRALLELIDVVLEESAHQLSLQELNIVPSQSIRTFASIKLDQKGISHEQETLPWQEIREFMTKNGTVTCAKKKNS